MTVFLSHKLPWLPFMQCIQMYMDQYFQSNFELCLDFVSHVCYKTCMILLLESVEIEFKKNQYINVAVQKGT